MYSLYTSSNGTFKTLGFTLVELIVTLSVLAILLVFAVPSFRTMILNNRLATSVNLLMNDLLSARVTAINNNADVKICPFNAPNSLLCGTNWKTGWIVMTQPTLGIGTLLKSQQNGDLNPSITSSTASITFDSHGLASTPANFSFCDTRGSTYARSIGVITTGYIQSGDTPGLAVWNNAPLICP